MYMTLCSMGYGHFCPSRTPWGPGILDTSIHSEVLTPPYAPKLVMKFLVLQGPLLSGRICSLPHPNSITSARWQAPLFLPLHLSDLTFLTKPWRAFGFKLLLAFPLAKIPRKGITRLRHKGPVKSGVGWLCVEGGWEMLQWATHIATINKLTSWKTILLRKYSLLFHLFLLESISI